MHIAIVDDTGSVTGIQGNLLEKHVSVSKALDSISQVNSPQKIWYKNYLADFSNICMLDIILLKQKMHIMEQFLLQLVSLLHLPSTQLVKVCGDKMHKELHSVH